MEKVCKNCYWYHDYDHVNHCHIRDDAPNDLTCDRFDYACECGNEFGGYELDGKIYCSDCILEEVGIETYTVTHYQTSDGEYLGSESDDFLDILKGSHKEIKEID